MAFAIKNRIKMKTVKFEAKEWTARNNWSEFQQELSTLARQKSIYRKTFFDVNKIESRNLSQIESHARQEIE